jgi:hypothetical protein
MSRYRESPMDITICGWGRCAEPTEGHPLCERHLRKAWAIVQARLSEEQRHAIGHGD